VAATARQLQLTPTQSSYRDGERGSGDEGSGLGAWVPDLTDVALGHGRGRRGGSDGGVRQERHPLVLPGELVGGVHLLVAGDAERGLVRAAQHPRLRGPARVALDLHPRLPARVLEVTGHEDGGDVTRREGIGIGIGSGSPFSLPSSLALAVARLV
jgi:hypothetical protein